MFSIYFYKVVHIVALAIVIGYTFYAFAAPPETRKRVLVITGLGALLMFISGFAIMHKVPYEWHAWVWVKLVCWLGLAAISGLAYRRRNLQSILKLVVLLLVGIATYMVVYKPASLF